MLALKGFARLAASRSSTSSFRSPSTATRVSFAPKRSFGSPAHNKPAVQDSTSSKDVVDVSTVYVTGPEKEELLGLNYGDLELHGPFGTLDKPVVIESIFESRVVGCAGGPTEAEEHDLLWHIVKEERPTICLDCGQVFQLRRLPLPEGAHLDDGHGHGHGHGDAHGQGHGHNHGKH